MRACERNSRPARVLRRCYAAYAYTASARCCGGQRASLYMPPRVQRARHVAQRRAASPDAICARCLRALRRVFAAQEAASRRNACTAPAAAQTREVHGTAFCAAACRVQHATCSQRMCVYVTVPSVASYVCMMVRPRLRRSRYAASVRCFAGLFAAAVADDEKTNVTWEQEECNCVQCRNGNVNG